jgi:hypothetical protein
MGFFEGIKSFFLPSESVSRQRRLNVFGTESKAVAGAAVVGAAATAIAAPLILGTAAGRAAIGSAVSTSAGFAKDFAIKNPITSAAVGGFVVPVATLAAIKNPSGTLRTVGKYGSFVEDASSLVSDPSKQGFVSFVKQHPIGAGVLAGGAAVGVASGVGHAAEALSRTVNSIEISGLSDKISKVQPAGVDNGVLGSSNASSNSNPIVSANPLLAANKPVKNPRRVKKKRSKKKPKKRKKKSNKKKRKKKRR